MNDIIQVNDQFYILATSALAGTHSLVLKHGETFALFDAYGDIQPIGQGEQGLYHEGTRFLARLELRLGQDRPLFLSSGVREDNSFVAVDLTNREVYVDGHIILPHSSLHISRIKFLWQAGCYERLRLATYGHAPVTISLVFNFETDFADIFEVRGANRKRKGQQLSPLVEAASVVLRYAGLDGVRRQTRLSFAPAPAELSESRAVFSISLRPGAESLLFLTVTCESSAGQRPQMTYAAACTELEEALKVARAHDCVIDTSNAQFNHWLRRSSADLHMLITDTAHGPYPYAGVPWFSTAFGRDGIITALESLWVNPTVARDVLAYLAATQAHQVVPAQDAEPGKILHETRRGEMAALGEIPFGLYYGGVDTTPLFVLLAGAYYEHTGDLAFIEAIWPNIDRALQWIDTYGDLDGDGFVEYAQRTTSGLVSQGWKDSHDAIFHADGTLAEAPIALCEVQGYVYAAKRSAAELAAALGKTERAMTLAQQSQVLQTQFERIFWCEELSTYALALDGKKQLCQVRSSNAGHCLFTGIASPEHARHLAGTLLKDQSFSGWGIRTVPSSEVYYNPMSYHNGSIWPHDNALIAYGLARYGFKDGVQKILTGLFDASVFMQQNRLPELFCGFDRRDGQGPTRYPVACAPQAWAVASVYLLLQACLGLSVSGTSSQVRLTCPVLPEALEEVRISNLKVGAGSVDLTFHRYPHDVSVTVTRRVGNIEVITVR